MAALSQEALDLDRLHSLGVLIELANDQNALCVATHFFHITYPSYVPTRTRAAARPKQRSARARTERTVQPARRVNHEGERNHLRSSILEA
jgi:hypothetical protein